MVAPAADKIDKLISKFFPPHKSYEPNQAASKMESLKKALPPIIIKAWRESQRKLKQPLEDSHRELKKLSKDHQRQKTPIVKNDYSLSFKKGRSNTQGSSPCGPNKPLTGVL